MVKKLKPNLHFDFETKVPIKIIFAQFYMNLDDFGWGSQVRKL